jgi:hypothetical protein
MQQKQRGKGNAAKATRQKQRGKSNAVKKRAFFSHHLHNDTCMVPMDVRRRNPLYCS